MKTTTHVIGIDLGTTQCCVAVYENHSTEILVNKQGSRTTPSWVACSKGEQVVGDSAKDQAVFDPENVVYDMKRLIGLKYDDATVQQDMDRWLFNVKCDQENLPKVKVKWNGKKKKFKPEAISAIILNELKIIAKEYLDSDVTKAVITVPAYFNDNQRRATMEAGKIAGLEVVRLLNEPTAAALAYAVKKNDLSGTILVFDLGGGTLDVSIVTITDSRFIVQATKGNAHLGGEDFTNRLLDYMVDLIRKSYPKSKLNKTAIARIKRECEELKKRLSFAPSVSVYMDGLVGGKNFNTEITKEKFCKLNEDLFNSVLEPIKDALVSANITKDNIDKIVMVGGSSRIPKIQEILKLFFGSKQICLSINPEEAIASGAAIFAAIQDGIKIRNRDNFTVEDVIPRSLGIECVEEMCIIIEKNSTMPISEKRKFATIKDNQTTVRFPVYEGESPQAKDNNLLGEFTITDVPPKPAGVEEFVVEFIVDSNGLFKVTATHISTGNEMKITYTQRIGSRFD